MQGVISVPGITSTNNLQFVEDLGTNPLGTGTVQLDTTDNTTVAQAVQIMEKSGPEAVSIQQPPILISLLRNAEIGISGLFLISGTVSIIALTVLQSSERKSENLLRMKVGATLRRLIFEQSWIALPLILIGTLTGLGVAVIVTSIIAGSPPPVEEFAKLTLGVLVGDAFIWSLTALSTGVSWSRNLKTSKTQLGS